jgi:peptide/nickel transport system ATP-binding protein
MDANMVLDVRHLSVDYQSPSGDVHAVDDVSFTLGRGQILGLAGESGSGKSTLAYGVARLLRPPAQVTGGQVFYYPRPSRDETDGDTDGLSVEGVDLDLAQPLDVLTLTPAQLRAFRWRTLSFVFQSAMNALNPVLSVHAQIIDVLRTHYPHMSKAAREARARDLVRLVGIAPDRLHSYPHELSGGMRQRAVIAIALALSPEIIILDEPTTALDVVIQREILLEVLALRERLGFSVIFITHDLSLLLEVADAVAIMYAGRVVEMADRRSLYKRARHPYTYGLLHSFPALRGPRRELTGIPGSPPDLRTLPPGCAFHPRCAFAMPVCADIVPLLRSPASLPPNDVAPAAAEQQVACHLYDAALNPAGPPPELRPADAASPGPHASAGAPETLFAAGAKGDTV